MSKLRLVDCATGCCLLPEVVVAQRFVPRLLGLMGRRSLKPETGLYLPRCSSIHMFFMRFPIDAVYLAGNEVRKIVHGLKPMAHFVVPWCRRRAGSPRRLGPESRT